VTEPITDFAYPLTTWPQAPVFLTRGNAADAYPRALTPLSQDLVLTYEELGIRDFYIRRLGALRQQDAPRPLMSALYGHVYLDVEELGVIGDRMPGTTRRDIYQQLFGLKVDPSSPAPPSAGKLVEIVGMLRLAPRVLRMSKALPAEIERLCAAATGARGSAAESLAWLQRLDALQVRCWSCLPVGSALASAYYGDVVTRLTPLVGERAPELANRLHVGLGGNETAEVGTAIRRLSARVRADAGLAERLVEDPVFRAVIERFGYRAAAELELSNPSWREDPAPLLRAVTRGAEASVGEREHLRATADEELAALSPGRGLRSALGRSRRMMPLRENAKLPICRLFDEYRRLLAAVTPGLIDRGVIDEPELVHQLRHAELHAVLDGAAGPGVDGLRERRAQHAHCLELTMPEIVEAGPGLLREVDESFYRDRGLLAPPRADREAEMLGGVGASAGVAVGTARVMHDPDEEFDAGDILVTATVDPGWTPVLVSAAAIVLDSGGEMSHGATVARELGIPCVVNVKHGTVAIATGRQIEVDGGAGTVRVL
jgi:phosphohistidine swiveling domain-containing protein